MENFKFNSDGLIPCIIQDIDSGEVLMMAYMDKTALERTLGAKKTVFYSRSRKQYWIKGETSGHLQTVQQALTDCDRDTILIKVKQKGGACHLGYKTCFVFELSDQGDISQITQPKIFNPDQTYKK